MKTSFVRRLALNITVAFLASSPAWSTCGGGGGGGVGGMGSGDAFYVPWRHVKIEDTTGKDAMTVYWIPASIDDFQKSPLRYSRPLTLYAGQCVGLCAVDSPESPVGQKYATGASLPVAVLVSSDGTVIGKAESTAGTLTLAQVEDLVTTEYKKRDDAVRQKMESAAGKARDGDAPGAIADYRSVVEQRCLFPRRAREAARRMTKLGTEDVSNVPDSPDFDAALGARIEGQLKEAIADEMADKYAEAEQHYLSAHKLDPADPTPLRYLGELYRHELGDWDKAGHIFDEILALHADPLSRAVALHGLGKMTIHDGQFRKGEKLMEESAEIYPLAMTYRNLAVYWNSEGDAAQAAIYTEKALKEDPKDPFNIVFAATFMAASGRGEEALKIARENEALMPASYNLAAIYAQTGQKQKALELLKRHFFQYERYQKVRSKEMMEARVDKLFEPIVADPEFLLLTNGADGRLPMRGMKNAQPAGH